MSSTLKGELMESNECFIMVDIETTGPVPGLYSMYELGACVVGEEEMQFMRKVTLLSKNSYDTETLVAMHVANVDVLVKRKGASSPREVLSSFADWVRKVAGSKNPVFVANNASFDWMFIAWYFKKFGIENPFGHSALDMKAYFMGKTGCAWNDATLRNMAAHVGIPFATLPHRAIDDAIIQSKIWSALINKGKNV